MRCYVLRAGVEVLRHVCMGQANALVVAIQEKTAKAASLSPPTDNADFENLSLK